MSNAVAQRSIRPTWSEQANPADQQPQADAAQPMGTFYVHRAAPVKGAQPAEDGKCFFLLECYQVDKDGEFPTPGQVRDMKFHPSEAVYMPYYGHMARSMKGDAGLVVGYVEECKGTDRLSMAAEGVSDKVVTETRGLCYPRPQVAYVSDAPYFGPCNAMVAGIDETIRTMEAIEAKRSPKTPKPAMRRCCI